MKFILNLTIREIRSSWKRLLFFFLCIAIGVGSIVALRSLIQNLSQAVGGDARELLAADFRITSTSDFSPTDIAKIENIISKYGIVEAQNETIETFAMARPADGLNKALQFISLKGIEPPFPLVGKFQMPGGKPFDYSVLENYGAVVAPILLDELGLKTGDKIRIGEGEFTIRAAFDEEPGGSGGIRLGVRVFVEKKAFDEAGITQTRSRINRRILYQTSSDPTALVGELREELKGTTLRIQSYRETEERLDEQFRRTENYLSLTGLLILVLGGIGVWNVARVFVEQKRKSVAVLKCLGAKGTRIIFVYILQILALGFIGSLFGVFLAQIGLWFAQLNLGDSLPKAMNFSVHFSTALQGLLLGMLISLIFSVLPLLQVRTIKPNLLLRDENNQNLRSLDRAKWLFGLICLAALLAAAAWQAGSVTVGVFFLVSLAVTSVILYVSAAALTWLLHKLKNFSSFSIKQSINSLYRPGNQTRIILLAVGLGAFVVLSVQMLQTNLVREFDFSRNQRLPSLFFVDIQKSQVGNFRTLVNRYGDLDLETIPTIRARISHINGEAIDYTDTKVRRDQGRIGREFAVTYREDLDENETLIAGKWWESKKLRVPLVSVEDEMAEILKVSVGDSITFDISGRAITTKIANIRKLDLRNTRSAFLFVFHPGVLDKAPRSFAANTLRQLPAKQRQKLQRDVIDSFPNVQIFDVAEIVSVIQNLIENFVLAVSFVGSFVAISGILILIGSIGLTKSQRVYENSILKTLGAKRSTLATILFAEYGILGTLAGIIGAFFATLLSFAVSVYLLDIEWEFDPLTALFGVFITAALVMLTGILASFDVLFKKPLKILRSQ